MFRLSEPEDARREVRMRATMMGDFCVVREAVRKERVCAIVELWGGQERSQKNESLEVDPTVSHSSCSGAAAMTHGYDVKMSASVAAGGACGGVTECRRA